MVSAFGGGLVSAPSPPGCLTHNLLQLHVAFVVLTLLPLSA